MCRILRLGDRETPIWAVPYAKTKWSATMKKIYVGLFSLLIVLSSCATIQTKMGAVALKLMTKKEADFSKMAAIGSYQSNMYAADVGITTLGTEDWLEGENLVGVQLVKPAGAVGVIALDGTVTVGGKEAKSYGGGAYFARFDANDKSSKKVVLSSSNGETTEFTIAPLPSLTIKAVNGQRENVTIDVNEPFDIELEFDAAAEGKRVTVSLITKAVGAKGFANFQSAIIDGRISIPAAAFRHKHIAGAGPTGKDVTNWLEGENYLQVSIIENDRSTSNQPFSYFKKTRTSMDTFPVTVTGNAEGRSYVRIRGEVEESNGKYGYEASSNNAWYARPLNTKINRIGIASIAVSGTLYKEETETTERESYMNGYAGYGRYKTITTTTTTFEFPQLDDSYWNQFLESIYSDLAKTLTENYGANLVSVNDITANPIYDEFYTPQDENNKEYIAKNLRDTKRLMAVGLEAISDRTTSLIADNGTMPRLLRDMNLEAVMNVVINYQVASDSDDKIVLLPNISYQVIGLDQSFDGNSSTWLQGNIKGPGVPFNKSEFNNLDALNRIGQKDLIISLIQKSIDDLTKEQAKFGYNDIWNVALSN